MDQPWLVAGRVQPSWRQRSHLTAYLSSDDGLTWKGGLLLDDRLVVSYPDADQGPDGIIYVIYDHNRESDREILLARFTEAEVADGKISEPGSALRLLVNRATGARP